MKLFSSLLLLFLSVIIGVAQKRKPQKIASSFKSYLTRIEGFRLIEILNQKFSKTSIDVKHAFLLSLLFVTMIASNQVFSQSQVVGAGECKMLIPYDEEAIKNAIEARNLENAKFQQVCTEVVNLRELIESKDIKDVPAYPAVLNLETMTIYLQRLQEIEKSLVKR